MPYVSRKAAACAAATVVLIAACTLVPGCEPGQITPTGTVNLRITDAPFPIDLISEATVTISRIDIRLEDDAQDLADGEEDAESRPDTDDIDDSTADFTDDSQPVAAQRFDPAVAQLADEGGDGKPTDETGDTDETDTEEDDESLASPWITIFDGEKAFNLLDLRNGRTDLLTDAVVPAGTYTQMRLIVTTGSITLTDGRTFDLHVPSGAQTGIKLHFVFTVEEGEEQPLLLDVDLSRTFRPIPGSGLHRPEDIREFKFQPALGMRLINLRQAGSISGTVTNAIAPLGGAAVTALRDGQEITTTSTESDGTYMLVGLPSGTYTVAFAMEGYLEQEASDVAVEAGQTTAYIDAVMIADVQ